MENEQATTQETTAPVITEPVKAHTAEELNAAAAAARRDSELKIAKEFGFDDVKAFKEWSKANKGKEDSAKDEAQKLAEANKAQAAQLAEIQARADKAEAKAEALGLGIPADKIDRFMRLALTYDGETVADKVKAAVADNPEFKAPAQPTAFGSQSKSQGDPKAAMQADLRKAMGLKNKS